MVWFRCAGAGLLVAALVAMAGCSRGVAEFQLYSQAFDAQFTQGEAILDAVARAEKTLALFNLRTRNPGVPDFHPNDSAYFVDGADPPITGSLRASLKTLKAYNAALGGLANGEAADALTNRINTLTGNIVGALAATQGAFGSSLAGPQVGILLSQTDDALKLANPIVKQVASIAARETFRRELIRTYRHMKELLLALRRGTPAMFELLRLSRSSLGTLNAPRFTPEALAALERDRVMLAAWVVLMDKTLVAMEAAAAAVLADSPAADFASLAEASIELRVLAEQIKALRAR